MSDESTHGQMPEALLLLQAVHSAQQAFLRGQASTQEIFDTLLSVLLEMTESEYGFIGKAMLKPDTTPYLKIFSMTNIAWDKETQALYERHRVEGMEFGELASLYGHVLTTQQPYISNAPATDPHKFGRPHGHPPLKSFLGIPIVNASLLGMVGVANRASGYTPAIVSFLEPLISTCAVIIEALNERVEKETAMKNLLASERRYHAIAESITDVFFSLDARLHFTYWNKASEVLTGIPTSTILGKHLFEVFPRTPMSEEGEATYRKALETGAPQHHVSQFAWGGKEFVFEVSVYPSSDGVSVFAQNVTQRTRAEAEREQLVEFLNQTETVAKVGGWEYDIVGGTLRVTEGITDIHELPSGTTLTIEGVLSTAHPDDAPQLRNAFDALLHEGKPHNVRVRCITAKGNVRWVRAIGRRETKNGTPTRLIGTLQDITEQSLLREQIEQQLADLQRSNEELHSRQQFLNAVLHTAPSTLYVYNLYNDTAQILNSLNPNIGHSKEFLETHSIHDMVLALFDEDSLRVWSERKERLLSDRTNDVYPIHVRYRSASGEWCWGLDHAAVLTRTEDGVPVQALCASTDVTDLKRAEEYVRTVNETLETQVQLRTEELTQLNKEKEELLNIAAHDLKNPLQGVALSAGVARRHLLRGNTAKVEDILNSIERISFYAGETIETFLNASAIESGAVKLQIESVESRLIAEIAELYSLRAKEKSIALHVDIPATPLRIWADSVALREVVENLLSNAVKYSPTGKRVFVRVHASEGAFVRVEVQDEGPGISAEEQQKLFGKFTRLSAKPTGGEHSTGLGLHIVKKLVETMNGRVWCESELGKGAMFVVELPAALEAPQMKTNE